MPARHRVSMIRNLGNAIRIATRPGSPALSERAAALPRMVRATLSGQYDGTSVLRLAAMAGAVAYIVSPVDLMPEGLFAVFGLADDAMVLSWLAANLVTETEDFLAWERSAQPFAGDGPSYAGGEQPYAAPGAAGSEGPFGAPRGPGGPRGSGASGASGATVPGRVVD